MKTVTDFVSTDCWKPTVGDVSECQVLQTIGIIGKKDVLVDPMRTIIVGRFRLGRLKESIYMTREVKIPRQAKHLGSAILDP